MFKKALSLVLCLCVMLAFSACGKPSDEPIVPSGQDEPTEVTPVTATNLLTGVSDLSPDKTTNRPVAIMIDNDSVAQKNAQAGVQTADIVYETEVEGGITRLMILFADVNKAVQIGDIRSARAQFVELATGHNAIYVHHGRDEEYCGPLMSTLKTDNFVVGTNNCGWRHTYGSATNWQNLYTTGEKLYKSLNDSKWKLTQEKPNAWQNFVTDTVTLSGGTANKTTVAFSGSATSYFTYDSATGKYIKTSSSATNKDVVTGDAYAFKNVFVLKTSMTHYPNGKHRKISFQSGSGYYLVNGKYEEINWKKGDAKDPLVFTNKDGTPLEVEAGNSWVCIAKTDATVTFE